MASTKPALDLGLRAPEPNEPVQPSRQLRANRRASIARSPSVALTRHRTTRRPGEEWVRRRIVHHRALSMPGLVAVVTVALLPCSSRPLPSGPPRRHLPIPAGPSWWVSWRRLSFGLGEVSSRGRWSPLGMPSSGCTPICLSEAGRSRNEPTPSTRRRRPTRHVPRRSLQLTYVHAQLEGDSNGPSIRWALATGYLSVLSSLHRAEEAHHPRRTARCRGRGCAPRRSLARGIRRSTTTTASFGSCARRSMPSARTRPSS